MGALNDRIDKEIRDRQDAVSNLESRMNEMNDNRGAELDELKTKLMKENAFLKMLASKPMSVCFDAYRTKAYDGGGEENLTFQGTSVNTGGGMDPDTGIFLPHRRPLHVCLPRGHPRQQEGPPLNQ